jgi:putative phosphoesterase
MKIGVISDTHDRTAVADAALQRFHDERVDLVIHCGDWKTVSSAEQFAVTAHRLGLPVQGVLGNNDHEVEAFLQAGRDAPGSFELHTGVLELTLDSLHVAAYHGHHRPTLNRLTQDTMIDVLLLGHTHKPLITPQSGRLTVNPGSVAFAIPRSKDFKPSIAVVRTRTLQAEIMYLS